MERLEGLDEEFQKEETEKVTSIEETKKKRPPFHYWEVAGDHKTGKQIPYQYYDAGNGE